MIILKMISYNGYKSERLDDEDEVWVTSKNGKHFQINEATGKIVKGATGFKGEFNASASLSKGFETDDDRKDFFKQLDKDHNVLIENDENPIMIYKAEDGSRRVEDQYTG